MKLDRLIRQHLQCGQRSARDKLRSGCVSVNGLVERKGSRLIERFDHVRLGKQDIQARIPHYVALHKPRGYVSATMDPEHPTVIDLIKEPWAGELHLAGRLDRYTTGLVILTNDSRFSEALTQPESKVPKVYHVETDIPITEEAVAAFKKGMPFAKEGVRSQPAEVQWSQEQSPHSCILTIFEGKHHQVKRMFARFDIKVTRLHRESVGTISLGTLKPGDYRMIPNSTVQSLARRSFLPLIPEGDTPSSP